MFWHNFKYSLLTLVRSKALIFWTFAFPLLMATFFHLAFGKMTEAETLSTIDIAVVDNMGSQSADRNIDQSAVQSGDDNVDESAAIYKETLAELSSGEEKLFNITYVTKDAAEELLKNDEIVGYLEIADAQPKVVVKTNGVSQTILVSVIRQIDETERMIKDITEDEIAAHKATAQSGRIDYQKVYNEAVAKAAQGEARLHELETGKLDYIVVEFFTLVAMTCMYGGILGMAAINPRLANMSKAGRMVAVAPTRKSVVVISSALAAYIVQLVGLGILFVYTCLVLGVDYGSNVGLIILLALVGSLAGLALGTLVTVVLKCSENAKTGIIIAITMLACFFAGMMGVTTKYYFDKNIPWLNMINPAGMITDGFYALYYYGAMNKYWLSVGSLVISSVVMLAVSAVVLGRQKYDNI